MAFGLPLAFNLSRRVDSEVRSQASGQADLVAASAADLLSPPRRSDLQRLAQAAANSVHGRVIVVDARGVVLSDSAGPATLGSSYASRPEVRAALSGRRFQTSRPSQTLHERLLATAVPVLRGGHTLGAVRVTQSVAAVQHAVRRTILGLVLVAVLVLALGLAAGAFIAARVSQPLRRLEAVARRVAQGELAARARPEGTSEQRSLAYSFNEMTERLGRLVRSQQSFVADASHQLRTPLTSLRLRLEEARAAGGPGAAREELEAGLGEIDRLAEIIDELLVLSRAGEHDAPAERVSLVEVAERAVDRWLSAAGEQGVTLELVVDEWVPVRCAPADADRALESLLENAVLYSGARGRVQVHVYGCSIEVLDQGPGLAPGEREEVFERFHRGRAGRAGPSGTGLGLAIARELAQRWAGEVALENREGGGARATLSFPAFAGALTDAS